MSYVVVVLHPSCTEKAKKHYCKTINFSQCEILLLHTNMHFWGSLYSGFQIFVYNVLCLHIFSFTLEVMLQMKHLIKIIKVVTHTDTKFRQVLLVTNCCNNFLKLSPLGFYSNGDIVEGTKCTKGNYGRLCDYC